MQIRENRDTFTRFSFSVMSPNFRKATPSHNTSNDVILIANLRSGDPSALRTLVNTYAPALIRHARRILPSHDVARDVVQDVFLELWSERETFDVTRDIAAYLFWRTRNRALNVRRAEIATRRREGRWSVEHETSLGEIQNTGEAVVDAEAAREEIWRALANVPPRSREIFMMVWDRQLSYADIAQRLGLSVTTVRSQVSRALKHLIETLGPRFNA